MNKKQLLQQEIIVTDKIRQLNTGLWCCIGSTLLACISIIGIVIAWIPFIFIFVSYFKKQSKQNELKEIRLKLVLLQ